MSSGSRSPLRSRVKGPDNSGGGEVLRAGSLGWWGAGSGDGGRTTRSPWTPRSVRSGRRRAGGCVPGCGRPGPRRRARREAAASFLHAEGPGRRPVRAASTPRDEGSLLNIIHRHPRDCAALPPTHPQLHPITSPPPADGTLALALGCLDVLTTSINESAQHEILQPNNCYNYRQDYCDSNPTLDDAFMGESFKLFETGVQHIKIPSPAYRVLTRRGYGVGVSVGLCPQTGICDSYRRQQRYYEPFNYGVSETVTAVPHPRCDSRDNRQSPEYYQDDPFRHCCGQILHSTPRCMPTLLNMISISLLLTLETVPNEVIRIHSLLLCQPDRVMKGDVRPVYRFLSN